MSPNVLGSVTAPKIKVPIKGFLLLAILGFGLVVVKALSEPRLKVDQAAAIKLVVIDNSGLKKRPAKESPKVSDTVAKASSLTAGFGQLALIQPITLKSNFASVLEAPKKSFKQSGVVPGLHTPGYNLKFDEIAKAGLKVINADLTFYSIDYQSTGKYPGDPAYGITSFGDNVKDCKYKNRCFSVAADLSHFGNKPAVIFIEGLGFRKINDKCPACAPSENRLDVLVPSDSIGDQLSHQVRRVVILPDNYPIPDLN